jgi:hypothetical protein
MSHEEKKTALPASRLIAIIALVALPTTTLILGVLLALLRSAPSLPTSSAHALQLANLVVSGAALLVAAIAAWKLFHRARKKTAEGVITVCAWTRRVLWEGRWISFEEYLANRFNVQCTHGICDEAAEKLRDAMAKTEIPPELRRTRRSTDDWRAA